MSTAKKATTKKTATKKAATKKTATKKAATKKTATKKTATKKTATKKTATGVAAASHEAHTPAGEATTGVSMETLNGTVGRAVVMLRAIGTSQVIRVAMATVGYDDAEHRHGWNLVHAASGFVPGADPLAEDNGDAAAAIERIDASDEDAFRIVRATLTRRFPAQAAFVLGGIGPSKGAAAVVGMRTLLDRLDALERDPRRAETATTDHAALALLAKRGLDAAYRARMRSDVHSAERLAPAPAPKVVDTLDGTHLAALEALRVWFEEWSELARVAIKRRDLLIRMGFAKRKAKPQKSDGGDAPPT